MKEVFVKHVMDKEFRKVNLNDIFMEALELSSDCSCDIEHQEYELHKYLAKHPNFINCITEDYKFKVLKGWEYEVKSVNPSNIIKDIRENILKEFKLNDLGNVSAVLIGPSFAVIKTEKANVSLIETHDENGIFATILQEPVNTNGKEPTQYCGYPLKDIEIINIEGDVYIADVDDCTSQVSITLTNGKEVMLELLRDKDFTDDPEYDFIVLGERVTYE